MINDSRQFGANQTSPSFEISDDMLDAGLAELENFRLCDDKRELLDAIYRAMSLEAPPLLLSSLLNSREQS